MKKIAAHYIKPYYLRMMLGFGIKFLGTIMDLFLPWTLAYMIDTVVPEHRMDEIAKWGGFMILCSIMAVTFNIIPNRMASRVASDAIYDIRKDLFTKVMYLTNQSTDQITRPSLISRLTSDTYNFHQMLARVQRLGVRAPILLFGGVVMTMMLDAVLACILLATLPLLALVVALVSGKSIPMFYILQERVDKFVRVIREDIAGIRVIKALSKVDYEQARFEKINREVVSQEQKATMTTAITNPVMNSLLNLGLVAVIIVGAHRVNEGTTEVGRILAFMTYFTIILNALLSISRLFIIISKASASAGRIQMVLEAESEQALDRLDHITTPEDETDKEMEKEHPHVEFREVSFSYDKIEPNLERISFSLKRGETLGIIGATGAGKSTMVHLLMRFYELDKGLIRINGIDIQAMNLQQLRRRIGTVLQNDSIFEDTILENIQVGRMIGNDQVLKAAAHAGAKEFIEEKGGMDQPLDIKGANLSGGQKQRLFITRALAGDPEILILDDSSSALDYKTDAALRKELRKHYRDTSCIIIAQRISSIMAADHILVIEDGRTVGYGSHEELMESCEVYREIGVSQLGSTYGEVDYEASKQD